MHSHLFVPEEKGRAVWPGSRPALAKCCVAPSRRFAPATPSFPAHVAVPFGFCSIGKMTPRCREIYAQFEKNGRVPRSSPCSSALFQEDGGIMNSVLCLCGRRRQRSCPMANSSPVGVSAPHSCTCFSCACAGGDDSGHYPWQAARRSVYPRPTVARASPVPVRAATTAVIIHGK